MTRDREEAQQDRHTRHGTEPRPHRHQNKTHRKTCAPGLMIQGAVTPHKSREKGINRGLNHLNIRVSPYNRVINRTKDNTRDNTKAHSRIKNNTRATPDKRDNTRYL